MLVNEHHKLVKKFNLDTQKEFESRFGLTVGSVLKVDRGQGLRPCSILGVKQLYINRGGGYTAELQVATLLMNGSMGIGRSLTVACNPDGTGFHGVAYKTLKVR